MTKPNKRQRVDSEVDHGLERGGIEEAGLDVEMKAPAAGQQAVSKAMARASEGDRGRREKDR
jgi:hypothetical protein